MQSRDRRSSVGNGKVDGIGKVERPPHQRGNKDFTFMSYFAEGTREVRRDEFLGILEMLEFHRRENVLWKRGLRWLFRRPGPWHLTKIMADNFYKRSVKPRLDAAQAAIDGPTEPARAVPLTSGRVPPSEANLSGGVPGSLIRPAHDGDDDLPPGLHRIGTTRE